MSSDFLTGLANQLGEQFSLNENENRSLDIANDGTVQRYGKLGSFAKQIDQTQQRRYLQEGYLRNDYYNATPKQLEILFQEPDVTVLVKKRAFCSVAENFQLDHMNADEKLFYKATKILFANKCKQIAAFERLSKIQRISAETGSLSAQLIPLVISLVDELDDVSGTTSSQANSILTGTDPTSGGLTKLKNVIDKLRQIYSFSTNNFYTTWLTDISNPFNTQYAKGTGVIEFCNITNVTTTTSINFEGGSISLNITDPYNMMRVTNYDIEKALSDATNQVYNSKTFQFGQDSIDALVSSGTKQLNDLRARRGATPIQFLTNPNTLLSKKVRAITGSGIEINFTYNSSAGLSTLISASGGVTVSPESLKGGPDIGNDGLDQGGASVSPTSEVNIFAQIISNIFTSLQLKQNSQSITQQNSDTTNYARRKLRLHYGGKLVIQPMDQVHVYIGSKARLDNKIIGGLQGMFTGLGFLQKLNHTATDFKNQFDSLFNPNGNANFQLEKNITVGPDFPNWLWTLTRNIFVNEAAGAHVFGGIIKDSEGSYRNGIYSVSVSGEDMIGYLRQGRVNFKPSIDVFNGPLYDPLTPFKTSFDTVANVVKSNTFDLLDENKEILASNSIKFKAGPAAGKNATETNMQSQDSEPQKLGNVMKVFYSPDGLVYKWKEGIGTLTQFSNSFVINGDNTVGRPSITKDPFAGQDVMNAISLSITGQPYNYATFYRAAREVDSFGRDPISGADAAFSYYKSLTSDLVKNNTLWGNFIPFKNLFIDEASYQKILTSQISILNANDKIDTQLNKIQDLTNSLQFALKDQRNDQVNLDIKNRLREQLLSEQAILESQYQQVNNQLQGNQGNQGLSVVGNDVSFEYDNYLNNDPGNNSSLSQPSLRRELRRKINFLTRRLSWQVRANEDKNFLIIDDSYDKDYDIQAFEKSLGDMRLFDSEFTDVADKVVAAAQLLNLEVYCDPQGHIRVRPPMYNRMPSSVFYRLFQLKQQNGIQIFPQFLESLFVNQLQTLVNNLEIIEDQIRLDGAVLGRATDSDVYTVIRGIQGGQQARTTLGNGEFTFLTDELTGNLTAFDALFIEADPDKKLDTIDNSIAQALTNQAKITNAFNAVQKATFINTELITPSLNGQVVTTQIAQQRLSTLISRLTIKTGQQVNIDNLQSTKDLLGQSSSNAPTPDIFKISNDIAQNLVKRQNLVKQLSKTLNNAKEAISLDNAKDSQRTANRLLTPDISPNSQIPEVFESMVEDETYDDLGPNSGKRYVIEEYQILSFSIKEKPPDFTMVTVNGQMDLFLPNSELPQDLNAIQAGNVSGNALISATAVDYDMWRMYGFKNASPVAAPFLSDPQSQCAPYAATILSRARKEVLRGSLSISGNEYMQPGDVIYIKSLDLLFYVTSVSHGFTYGNTFQTNLELTYGHTPGEYIPTTLDIIGKLLYKNRDATGYVNYRQANALNQQSAGVIILDKRGGDNSTDQLFNGTYGKQNSQVLNDILYTTYFAVQSNKDPNSTVKANVELRIYYDSSSGGSIDSDLLDAANTIKSVLTGNFDFSVKSPISLTGKALDSSDITDPGTSAVDISGKTEFRSPSQKAMDMVRNISGSVSSTSDSTNQINTVLFGYIIDIWVTFTNQSQS